MGYYAIGIGGTGAKCIEALVHLCAAGLMPTKEELYVFFVDPDKSNGTLERAQNTLQLYTTCSELKLGELDLFKTPITTASPSVWSPFQDAKPTLDEFFAYSILKETAPNVAHLFDVLYSPEEKRTPLDEGFRGHPSIGAAVFADTVELSSREPWKTFRDKVALDAKNQSVAKIILFGSIFGGTGASGVPTIARLIKQELSKNDVIQNYLISAVTMLPYFSFDRIDDSEMRAHAENFLINTQAALKYYSQNDLNDVFDTLYVLGDHVLSPLGPPRASGKDPKGGKDQKNEPHFLELYAALGALDFFNNEKPRNGKCLFIARKNVAEQNWEDFSFYHDRNILKAKLDQMVRFSFAYLTTYYPTLESIYRTGRSYRAPWYVDFFERAENIQLSTALEKELLKLHDYLQTFLLWSANIQASAKEVAMELFNYNAYAEIQKSDQKSTVVLKDRNNFMVREFANLLLPREEEKPNSLSDLWERMCDAVVNDVNARGVGRFIHALYTQCKTEKFQRLETISKE